ncbi:glucosamine--fructose-6-phosphate aminotransferase [Ruminococcus bicirculans (ex Wegman et al. 2014)]|uniref:class II glutamine amidotransferase n=1 Tax=Ruminococcus bicirculans (ex Wegman et al. 2014) TaxID=1160721 RepID=UPI00307693C7
MCAIFGFVNYRRSLSRSEMKELINRLSVESEVRGKDATGIAYVKHGELKVFKRAKPAHKVRLYVPEDTVILTGHTRMTTQGDARYIYNNHPFTGKTADGSFALCHNGVLYNDSQLAKSEHLPKSKIETDSYVAAQLIEKYGRLDFKTIAKGDNPLCLIHYKQLGLYVYTSTEDIMKNVLKGSFLEKLPFEVIKVTEGEIISIDKRGRFEKSSFVPNEFCYGWNYYGYRKPAYDDDELFDICGMFGVSQEDLMLLYDMGYTDEEIEGMLCDRSMLRECIEEARVLVGEYY